MRMANSCGLMQNFDKIQLTVAAVPITICCGLMQNFDKIQLEVPMDNMVYVVV